MRLVLVTDPSRVPVGYTLVAASEKEYGPVRALTTAHPGCTLIADKGLWGREYRETLALQEVTLLTPDRVRSADNLPREKRLAGLRLVIESTFSNLKRQMRLEQHLAKTPCWTRAADRSAAACVDDRHAPERGERPPTPSARCLRRTLNPHQASSGTDLQTIRQKSRCD